MALGVSSLSVGSDYGGFGTGSGSGGLLLQHSSSGYVAGGSGGSTLKLTGRPRSVRSVRSTHSDQQTQTNGRQRSTPRSRWGKITLSITFVDPDAITYIFIVMPNDMNDIAFKF